MIRDAVIYLRKRKMYDIIDGVIKPIVRILMRLTDDTKVMEWFEENGKKREIRQDVRMYTRMSDWHVLGMEDMRSIYRHYTYYEILAED